MTRPAPNLVLAAAIVLSKNYKPRECCPQQTQHRMSWRRGKTERNRIFQAPGHLETPVHLHQTLRTLGTGHRTLTTAVCSDLLTWTPWPPPDTLSDLPTCHPLSKPYKKGSILYIIQTAFLPCLPITKHNKFYTILPLHKPGVSAALWLMLFLTVRCLYF